MKTQDKKFSILLMTYNRHKLLDYTLQSIQRQSYQNVETFIIDRGSTPSAKDIVDKYDNKKFHYIEGSQNIRMTASLTHVITEKATGDYVVVLGDDDALVPTALERINDVLKNNDIKFITTTVAHYNHATNNPCDTINYLESFDGALKCFDPKEALLGYLSSWNIGGKNNNFIPTEEHPSAAFISKQMLDEIYKKYGKIYIEPFYDVTYVGFSYYAGKNYRLNLPLVVIGEGHARETSSMGTSNRHYWNREEKVLGCTGVKGVTWENCATTCHLQMAKMFEIDKFYNIDLRPNFFKKHISQILADNPKTKQTIFDFLESLLPLLKSYVLYPKQLTREYYLRKIKKLFDFEKTETQTKIKLPEKKIEKEFSNINDYASYLNDYIKDNEKQNNFWNEYNKINENFSNTLVFHLDNSAGFFSEINNLVLAILYCLQNKIKFVLFADDACFSTFGNGWEDFFRPFCPITHSKLHLKYNFRQRNEKKLKKYAKKIDLFKKRNNIKYLTYELFPLFHNNDFAKTTINIDELKINSSVKEASKIIFENIMRYNGFIAEEINNEKNKIKLPKNYQSMHIRSGDKHIEIDLSPTKKYMDKLQSISKCKDIFVATDDYSNIEDLKNNYPDYNFYTMCEKEQRGYLQADFENSSDDHKYKSYIKLLAEIELLQNGENCICTYSSNIGMYLGIIRDKVYSIDIDEWTVW